VSEARSDGARRRLDQWLWFARLTKSRSLAARLCNAGKVAVNGVPVTKSDHLLRAGDIVSVPQGPWLRSVQVQALGARRGPAVEARALFHDTASVRQADLLPVWQPLLADDGSDD